ncbi:MAG: hypothetical protein LBM67_07205 [Lentimicrobiaceae bacterium]|jgi:hypothetical protein|nr:hypothetical protein [Lentimicrobiaceae bacterium]
MTILYLIVFGALAIFAWKKYYSKLDRSALKYFVGLMSDNKYDAYVKSLIESRNLRQVALSKFDLDESELNELPPLCLSDYYFDEKDQISVKRGKDGKDRSAAYQVSWLFFGTEKICLYQFTLNFDSNGQKEFTQEYYWKDITNITTLEETKTVYIPPKNGKGFPTPKLVNIKLLTLIVPGDKCNCFMPKGDTNIDKIIRGIKSKLTEKKKE